MNGRIHVHREPIPAVHDEVRSASDPEAIGMNDRCRDGRGFLFFHMDIYEVGKSNQPLSKLWYTIGVSKLRQGSGVR